MILANSVFPIGLVFFTTITTASSESLKEKVLRRAMKANQIPQTKWEASRIEQNLAIYRAREAFFQKAMDADTGRYIPIGYPNGPGFSSASLNTECDSIEYSMRNKDKITGQFTSSMRYANISPTSFFYAGYEAFVNFRGYRALRYPAIAEGPIEYQSSALDGWSHRLSKRSYHLLCSRIGLPPAPVRACPPLIYPYLENRARESCVDSSRALLSPILAKTHANYWQWVRSGPYMWKDFIRQTGLPHGDIQMDEETNYDLPFLNRAMAERSIWRQAKDEEPDLMNEMSSNRECPLQLDV